MKSDQKKLFSVAYDSQSIFINILNRLPVILEFPLEALHQADHDFMNKNSDLNSALRVGREEKILTSIFMSRACLFGRHGLPAITRQTN